MDKKHIVSMERKCELFGVFMLAVTVILFLSLITDGFETGRQAGRPIDGMLEVPNLLGAPGALVAGILALLIGDAAHVLYAVTCIWMLKLFVHRPIGRLATRVVGLLLLTGAAAGLLQIGMTQGFSNVAAGGAFGAFVADRLLLPNFGRIGANVIGVTVAFMGVLLATDFLFIHFLLLIQRGMMLIVKGGWTVMRALWRAARWLMGEERDEDDRKRVAPSEPLRDAYALAADFTADIPEAWDRPVTRDRQHESSRFGQWLQLLTPRIGRGNATSAQTEPNETAAPKDRAPDQGAPPPKPPIAALDEELDAETDAPALPFGDIPDTVEDDDAMADMDVNATAAVTPFDIVDDEDQTASLPWNSDDDPDAIVETTPLPVEEDESAEAPDEPESLEESDDAQEALASELSAAPDPEPAVASAPKSKRNTPKLRRKPVNHDDVPHDYEYPDVYAKPALDLFTPAVRRVIPNLREKLGHIATHLEETLATFGLEARVADVTRGPTITRFELEPAPGMKVSRFLSLTDDIALALKAKGVRVEAPIPGKGRVGIEVSNEERDPVVIRELLEHSVFAKSHAGLNLALGKDIAGEVCIADLLRMPHLLVAGATGAGKTVCIKALLASLLFQHTPDELQLMLIDPKMVELSIFNDIPHLITPVVTDPKKASTALTWLINEMEERYRLFADLRVRNIEVYNESVENGEIEMEGDNHSRAPRAVSVVRKLPFIVCVIDELADLMMLARAEVEDSIGRLAQLARAVGIHLIIATQRPSVDVLTGVIKANFPARISFQVSSRVDSRCILDEIGAERLIGMGDMLYLPAGQSKPARIQGAFVSDDEMLALIAYLKRQAPPQYRDEIENFGKDKDTLTELEHEDDPLFEDAVRVVLETGQASISMVQRRLRVGYTRAARLIDMMELKGIVGPHTGSKAREILVIRNPEDDDDE